MFNIFKKKVKPEPKPRVEFTYTIFMKNGVIHKCKGSETDKISFAVKLSDAVEKFENNYFTTVDDGKIVLWTREIDSIKVD